MEVLMANKAGRPKAKVNITVSEDEMASMLKCLDFTLGFSIQDLNDRLHDDDPRYLRIIANDMLLYARLREIRDSKYGGKNE